MKISSFKFKNFKILLAEGRKKFQGVSLSSQLLAQIIPQLSGYDVLDLGCGVGYFTIGALYLGAKKVMAIDVKNVEKILEKNVKLNNFSVKKVKFIESDLFSKIPKNRKFDAIIANLPQHALPATPIAQKLKGKYGGCDGTELICRALAEGAYYLRPNAKFFCAISELTNFKRTFAVAETLYRIKIHSQIKKTLRKNEMEPYIKDKEYLRYLKELKQKKLIHYRGDGVKKPIVYEVYLCEFILKSR